MEMETILSPSSINGESMPAWSKLPADALYQIATLLPSMRDLFSFSSVCSSWRSAGSTIMSTSPNHHFPPLLLRRIHYQLNSKNYRPRPRPRHPFSDLHFFNIKGCHDSSGPYRVIPSKCLKRPLLASSHGHIIVLDKSRSVPKVLIMDFLSGYEIESPPVLFSGCKYLSVDKCAAVLSAPVSSATCSLLLLTHKSLFLWKASSTQWWSRHPLTIPSGVCFEQMVLIGERIFALDSSNTLFIISLPPDMSVCMVLPKISSSDFTARLVDCGGELLCLCFLESFEDENYELLQLDMSMAQPRWLKLDHLDNWAIFLSATMRATNFACKNPERWGGRSNCVYFASTIHGVPWFARKLGPGCKLDLFFYNYFEERQKQPIFWIYPSKF